MMPGKRDIMDAIRTNLDGCAHTMRDRDGDGEWTKAVTATLRKLGHELGYLMRARGVNSEWLYDVTWLEYSREYEHEDLENRLVNAHLIAECEWGGSVKRKYDFEKLLLGRATISLMIYDAAFAPGPQGVAEDFAGYVRSFNGGSRAKDAWLLAGRQHRSFSYFTITPDGKVVPMPRTI